jgi:putative transcriptional regulator
LARIAKDLSQEQLAEKINVARQTINLIETGKYNPTIELCLKICWELDTTLDELFWRNKEDV